MKTHNLSFLVFLVALAILAASCGGGGIGKELKITPPTASITTNYTAGTIGVVNLTAAFSDGSNPTYVQWSGGNGCILVDTTTTTNRSVAICNLMCSNTATMTITATADGHSATSQVTCSWVGF